MTWLWWRHQNRVVFVWGSIELIFVLVAGIGLGVKSSVRTFN